MAVVRTLAIALVLLISLSGVAIPQESSEPTWLLLVYMGADNNLEKYALQDFLELSRAVFDNVKVVVQMDRHTSWNPDSGYSDAYGNWTGAMRFVLTRGITPDPANATADLGEVDMGNPSTLRDFIVWAVENFTADYVMLDIWDHGTFEQSVVYDANPGSYLGLGEARDAIEEAERITGRRINILALDSCGMGSLQTVAYFHNVTDYLIASQKDVPADGFAYDDALELIRERGAYDPRSFGGAFVESYGNWARSVYEYSGIAVTLAMYDMGNATAFFSEMNSVLDSLISDLAYEPLRGDVRAATDKTLRFEGSGNRDLLDFFRQAYNETGDQRSLERYERMETALRSFIVNFTSYTPPQVAPGTMPADGACGLSAYLPSYYPPWYASTPLGEATLWDEFLYALYEGETYAGNGTMSVSLNGTQVSVAWNVSADHVILMVAGETYNLSSSGVLNITVPYGAWRVDLYGYNESGLVYWAGEGIKVTKPFTIAGRILINGEMPEEPVPVNISVDDAVYHVLQNSTGFSLTLEYPTEINETSIIVISVEYGGETYTQEVDFEHAGNIVMDIRPPQPPDMLIIALFLSVLALIGAIGIYLLR